ncbi:MAG TPA: cupredoxin domain-containing protein [Candidatus Limnocylindria bacterium]|nr:cupredoxin domain-containing protein [Candidatus Limnocylindria bacterium]
MFMLFALLGAATIALAAACGGGGGGTAAAPGQELTITLSDFKYDPPGWQISAGVATKVTLVNKGSVEHDFSIEVAGFKLLAPTARTVYKTMPALQPGQYDVFCTVAGHKEQGMKGILTVK